MTKNRAAFWAGLGLAATAAAVGCSSTATTRHMSPTLTPTLTATPVPTSTGTPNLSTSEKSVAPAGMVLPGQTINYYLDVINTGASPALNVVIMDNLPGGLNPSTVTFVAGPAGVVAGSVITWNIPSVPPGILSLQFTVQVSATATGSITNSALLSAANVSGGITMGPATNPVGTFTPTPMPTLSFTATASPTLSATRTFTESPTVTVAPNLAGSSKTGPAGGVVPNGAAHFYIQVANSGGSPMLNVTVSDTLAAQLDPATVVYWSGPAGNVAGSTITWNLGTLAGGTSLTLHFSVNVVGNVSVGTVVCNSATISSSNAGSLGVGPVCFTVIPPSSTFTPTPFGFSSMTFTQSPTITPTYTNTPFVPPTSTFTPTPSGQFIYYMGGADTTVLLSAVYSAPVLGSGGLGSWTNVATYPSAYTQIAAALVGGSIFGAAGYSGAPTSSVYRATASGGAVGGFSADASLPVALTEAGSTLANGYWFLTGGYVTSSPVSTVYRSTIAGGGLGGWSTTLALPAAITGTGATTSSFGYVYVFGGWDGVGVTSTVYSGFAAGGTIVSWNSVGVMPAALGYMGVATDGTTVHLAGGYDGAASSPWIYSTNLTAGGGIGAWTTTASPVGPADEPGFVYTGGYLYIFGGYGPTTACYSAPVSGTSIGSFTTQTALPVTNGYIRPVVGL